MSIPSATQYFAAMASSFCDERGADLEKIGLLYQGALAQINVSLTEGKLLDIGIAASYLSLPFKEKGLDVYGIDSSREMLDLAINNGIPAENLTQVDLQEDPIPHDEDTFTITVTSATLFFLSNACQVIGEMIDVTKPGGFIMIDPTCHNFESDGFLPFDTNDGQPTRYIQSRQYLEKIFQNAGAVKLLEATIGEKPLNTDELGRGKSSQSLFVLQKKLT